MSVCVFSVIEEDHSFDYFFFFINLCMNVGPGGIITAFSFSS